MDSNHSFHPRSYVSKHKHIKVRQSYITAIFKVKWVMSSPYLIAGVLNLIDKIVLQFFILLSLYRR